MYTQKDLVKLQQILALKFFGFDLQQIQKLMKKQSSLRSSLILQLQLLQEKIAVLMQAQATLQGIMQVDVDNDQMTWEKILEFMKVYTMIEQFEKNWSQQILNQQELAEYTEFEKSLKERFTAEDEARAQQQWHNIVQKIEKHIDNDPASAAGFAVAQDCLQFLDAVYGKKYAHLSQVIWEKGFKTNKIAQMHGMTAQSVAWLDKAIDAYYVAKMKK